MKTFDQKDIVTDTLLLFFCHVFFTVTEANNDKLL